MKAKLGPDHPDTLNTMASLANSYFVVGRRADALKLREETLALMKAKLGPDHPHTLSGMNSLAQSYAPLDGTRMPSSCARRRWRCGKPSSAPTTPTRSPA